MKMDRIQKSEDFDTYMDTWENNCENVATAGIRSDVSQQSSNVGKHVTKNKLNSNTTINNQTKGSSSMHPCKTTSAEAFTNITFSANQNSSMSNSQPIKIKTELTSPDGNTATEDEENTSPLETPKRAKLSKPRDQKFPSSNTHSLFSLSAVLEDSLVNECNPYRPTPVELYAKNIYCKPPYSYSYLIILALKNSKHGYLPVTDIYTFVRNHFPFYETATEVWKNSIRHNLSLSKGFEKVARYNPEAPSSRKGCLWAINPDKIAKVDEELARIRGKDPQSILRSMRYPDKLNVIESGCQGFGGIVESFKSQYGMATFASYIRLFMKEALTQEPCIQLENDHWINVSLPEKPISIHGVYVTSSQLAGANKSLPPVQSLEHVLPTSMCNERRRPTTTDFKDPANSSRLLQPAAISYHYNISPTSSLPANIPTMHAASINNAFRNFSPTGPPPIPSVANATIPSGSAALPVGSLIASNNTIINGDAVQQANCEAVYHRRYPGVEQTPRAARFPGHQGYYANPHTITSPINDLASGYVCDNNPMFLPAQPHQHLFHGNKVLVDPVVKLPPPDDSPFSSPPCFDANRTPSTHSVISSHQGLASNQVSPFAPSNFNSEFDPIIFGDIVHENFNNLYSPYNP